MTESGVSGVCLDDEEDHTQAMRQADNDGYTRPNENCSTGFFSRSSEGGGFKRSPGCTQATLAWTCVAYFETLSHSSGSVCTAGSEPCPLARRARRYCQLDATGSGALGRDTALVGNSTAVPPQGIHRRCNRYHCYHGVDPAEAIPGWRAHCTDAFRPRGPRSVFPAARALLPVRAACT